MRFLLPVVCLFALLQFNPVSAQEIKVGYVDIATIQKGYYRTYRVREEFETLQSQRRQEVEELEGKANVLFAEQERAKQQLSDPIIAEDARRQLIKSAQERVVKLNSLQRQLSELQEKSTEELAKKAKEAQETIAQDIQEIIAEVAAGKDLDFVLNRSFGVNNVPTMPYSSTKRIEDISEQVILQLNIRVNAPKDWTPADEE